MAVMSKLRDKTHLVLYTLLAAFLALIVFEWGMNFNGVSQGGAVAGKVNGVPIEYRQYEEVYQNLQDSFRRSAPQMEMTDDIENDLRDRAWNILVDQVLLEKQFEKFGITVSNSEVLAAVESDNPPAIISQNFRNPETGEIDRAALEEARQNPENADIWPRVEEIIRGELKVKKLEHLLQATVQVTNREVEELMDRRLAAYSATFLSLPYSAAGDDTLFAVTEAEIKNYYEQHKSMFRQDPTRSAEYVLFPLTPTDRDSMDVKLELEGLAADFAATDDDTSFVSLQSDQPDAVGLTRTRADYSPAAAEEIFSSRNLKVGAVIGPVADRGAYRLVKVTGISSSDPVARASHILVPKESADLARTILRKVRAGEDFSALAREHSIDTGSAIQGGDLGWFRKGAMVPAFEQAVFNAANGAIVGPIETQFGLHIIKVTGKAQKSITASEVVRTIRPSDKTYEAERRKAAEFQMAAEDGGFQEAIMASGLSALPTGEFTKRSMVPGIGFNNQVTQFAFNARKGAVSDIIDTENGFVIMTVTDRNDSGYSRLQGDLQSQIEDLLRQQKKGEALEATLAEAYAASGNDLAAAAKTLEGATLSSKADIRFSRQQSIDPYIMEAIAALQPGQVSSPVETADGRAIIALQGKTYPGNPDLEAERQRLRPQLQQAKTRQLIDEYFQAERATATIEDNR